MARTLKFLGQGQIAASAGSILTNGSNKTEVKSINIHNTNTSTETVKLYRVPNSGGSLGTAGADDIFYQADLAADESAQLEWAGGGMILESVNDSIQAATTTGSKVNYFINGMEE